MTTERMNKLLPVDVKILRLMADNDLKVSETAKGMYMHRNSIEYRLNRIKKITGKDPRKFYGLCELLKEVSDG